MASRKEGDAPPDSTISRGEEEEKEEEANLGSRAKKKGGRSR